MLGGDSLVAKTVYPDSWTYGGDSSAMAQLYYTVSAYTVNTDDPSDTTPTGTYYRDSANPTKLYSVVSYDQLKTSGLSIALSPAIWRITLSAYKTAIVDRNGSVANTDLVLTDTQYVKLSAGNRVHTISFALVTPENEETGTFSTSLAFYPPNTFSYVECTLYKYSYTTGLDGKKTGVLGTVVDSYLYQKTDLHSETTGIENYGYYYYVSGGLSFTVSSGTYMLVAAFSDVNGKYIARYPLCAVVVAGNVTTTDIVLHRSAFNFAPINCSDVTMTMLTFNNGSTDIEINREVTMAVKASRGLWQALASGESATGTFAASFTWKDNADNEAGYKIQKASSVNGTVWSNWSDEATLAPGSTGYTGTFATGAQYKIRVKAYNSFSDEHGTATEGFDSYVESEAFGIFTVTYNLIYTDSNSDTHAASVRTAVDAVTDGSIVAFVLPYVYGGDGNNVLLSTAGGYPYIVPPAAYANGYSLSWQHNGTTLSDIGGYAGVNMTVTPVWTQD